MKPILLCTALLLAVLAFTSYRKEKNNPGVSPSYTEYKVIEKASLGSLESDVYYYLSLGYKPAGGVSYNDGKYLQAVIREN